MARVKGGPRRAQRRKRILKHAEGYWGRRKNLHRTAKEAVQRAWVYAYRDRKAKKRVFRRLWITRINAALSNFDISYSRFIYGIKKAGIELDRSVLSEIALHNPETFEELVQTAKQHLQ